jgi:cytidine deaminase
MTEKKRITYEADRIKIEELEKPLQMLMQHARKISEQSYSPYSNFKVGAAVLLENGEIFTGANQENAAYPSGLCAERVALFYAKSKFPDVGIRAIAITARPADSATFVEVTPCGSCRQVMCEYEGQQIKPLVVIMEEKDQHVLMLKSATILLPFLFNRHSLKPKA